MWRVATRMSLRIEADSGGHMSSSWITHLGIESWYCRINSAKARSKYVRKESVLTCAAMNSAHESRWRAEPRGGRRASVCTITGMSDGMVDWM